MIDPAALIARADRMASDRGVFDAHWQEIRDVILPLMGGFTTRESPGQKNNPLVFDSTGEQANELLSAGLVGWLMNASTKWFGVKARDDRLNQAWENAVWLEHVGDRMRTVFNSPLSNFAPNNQETVLDYTTYGTGGMFVGDRPGKPILFQSRPLAELYLAENAEGRVDTVYRRFQMSARAALQEWGDAVRPEVGEAPEKDPERRFRFLQCVMPRADYDRGARDAKKLPVASVELSLDKKLTLRESGFHELPFITPRGPKRSGEAYGRGPGTKALADVKMLQRAMKANIGGAELAMRPPLLVADEGVLSPVRMTAGGLTTVRAELLHSGRNPVQAMVTGARPDLGEEFMASIRQRIGAAFYNNLLLMQRRDRMTATEVIQALEEAMRIMGLFLSRFLTEYLGPLIERVYAIMGRMGAFDPPPPTLAGADLAIEYVSPLANAQRLSEARGPAQAAELFAAYIQADPAILDNLDGDRSYRDSLVLLGAPRDWLRPIPLVQQMRQARSQAQRAAATQASVVDLAGAGADAAKAIKTLQPGGVAAGADSAAAAA